MDIKGLLFSGFSANGGNEYGTFSHVGLNLLTMEQYLNPSDVLKPVQSSHTALKQYCLLKVDILFDITHNEPTNLKKSTLLNTHW